MNELQHARELAALLLRDPKSAEPPKLLQGVIAGIAYDRTVTVYISGGVEFPVGNIKVFDHYTPMVNDVVWLVKNGPDLMVLGKLEPKLAVSEPWHTVGNAGEPAFQNAWVNFGGGHAVAGFYKDPTGVVHLKGFVKNGVAGGTIFMLPEGYRPMTEERFVANNNDTVCEFIVQTNGAVYAVNSNNVFISLAGVQFLAQADKDDRENEMIHSYALNNYVPQIGPPGMIGRPSIWRREDGMCMLVRGGWHSGTVGQPVWRVPELALPRDDWLWVAFGWTGVKAVERIDLRAGMADFMIYFTTNFRTTGIRWFPEGGGWNGDNWIPATMQNLWVPYEANGAQWRPPSYYKDPYGIVHLHGLMKNGTVGAVPAFTLPPGYRPAERTIFLASANGGVCRPDIQTDGQVQISVLPFGTTGYVSLDNIHFRAEA